MTKLKTITIDIDRAVEGFYKGDVVLENALRAYLEECGLRFEGLPVCRGCIMQEIWIFDRHVTGCVPDSHVVEDGCVRCTYLAGMLAVVVPLRAKRGVESIMGQVSSQLRDGGRPPSELPVVLDALGIGPDASKTKIREIVRGDHAIRPLPDDEDGPQWTTSWDRTTGRLHLLDEEGRPIGNGGQGWTLGALIKANQRRRQKN